MSRFARIPKRFTERLALGEITFDHYGVMTFIVASADYRSRQAVFPSLKALKDALRWERSPQHLRDVLRELRGLGEIAYEMKERSRAPYVFTIVPDDYFERPSANALQTREAVSFAVCEDRLQSGESANAGQHTDLGGSESPAVCSDSPSTSKGSTKEDHSLGGGTRDAELAFDSLLPDVKEAVERVRAANNNSGGLSGEDFDYLGTAPLDEIARDFSERKEDAIDGA